MTEKKPIYDPAYWKDRLNKYEQLHQAIYLCTDNEWEKIEKYHIRILSQYIQSGDKILDAGCAWGRLLGMLPESWDGHYVGLDLSPDFIEKARTLWFGCQRRVEFHVCDFRHIPDRIPNKYFDWAVLISIKPMIINNIGMEGWEEVEHQLRRVTNRIMFLEYNTKDPEEIIECSI